MQNSIDKYLDKEISRHPRNISSKPNPFDKPPHLSFYEWLEQMNQDREIKDEKIHHECMMSNLD